MSDVTHDLRGRSAPSEIRFGTGGKIAALLVVLLGIGALVGYGYETGQFKLPQQPVVSDSRLP